MRCALFATFYLQALMALNAAGQSLPACSGLHLVPAPRECKTVRVVRGAVDPSSIFASDPEDRFTAEDLGRAAAEGRSRKHLASPPVRVYLERAVSSRARQELLRNHLALDPVMREQGYIIVPDRTDGLVVIAETSAGIFYGAQTVKQLIRGPGNESVVWVPTLRDWPAMAHRGLSDDWSRGPLPNMEFLKREIRTLAAYKYNIFSPYFEHTFAYQSTPVAAFPGGALTADEGRELVEYAAKFHITVIPEQEAFGHLHHVLKFEQYSVLGETPHGSVLAPVDKGSLPQIGDWFSELARVFPGPYAHIGADETSQLGLGRTHDLVAQQGLGKTYLDFLSQIHHQLAPLHKRLLFWGDIAVHSPDLVDTLPKDMIAVPWVYDARADFTPEILPFTRAGLETWIAPGVNNWNRVYPDNNEALGNIRAFVRDGQKLGATGMLNTVWNDDGEGIFDENWFGVLFGAAASWQPGESVEDEFVDSFGQAFQNDESGKISLAERELMAAHAVLRRAGLYDAQDGIFWVDPFSPEGQQVAAKLNPVAPQLRLHAEKAISLLAEARAAGKLLNPAAVDAMELGARRIDFIGAKFEFAQECSDLYARARAAAGDQSHWDEVSEALHTIGSNNGRLEDIRDGYSQLGELFREAWLRDNRPYWLANNMARYQRATELWTGRGMAWQGVIQRWWSTHSLPPPAEAGLAQGDPSSPQH